MVTQRINDDKKKGLFCQLPRIPQAAFQSSLYIPGICHCQKDRDVFSAFNYGERTKQKVRYNIDLFWREDRHLHNNGLPRSAFNLLSSCKQSRDYYRDRR